MFIKNLSFHSILLFGLLLLLFCCTPNNEDNVSKYEPKWNSLVKYATPEWFLDGKFGIYAHWGVYSVPATGPNGTWYSHFTYMDENSPQRKHHEATYGPLKDFGYKDFIPMFKAEKFDADEWAELFEKSGAKWVFTA